MTNFGLIYANIVFSFELLSVILCFVFFLKIATKPVENAFSRRMHLLFYMRFSDGYASTFP